jgi:hypothetical protein
MDNKAIECKGCNKGLLPLKTNMDQFDKENQIHFHKYAYYSIKTKSIQKLNEVPLCTSCNLNYNIPPDAKCYQCLKYVVDVKYNYELTHLCLNRLKETAYVCSRECYDLIYNNRNSDNADKVQVLKQCASCLKLAINCKRCSICKYVVYCNKECQVKDWPAHKIICKPDK